MSRCFSTSFKDCY